MENIESHTNNSNHANDDSSNAANHSNSSKGNSRTNSSSMKNWFGRRKATNKTSAIPDDAINGKNAHPAQPPSTTSSVPILQPEDTMDQTTSIDNNAPITEANTETSMQTPRESVPSWLDQASSSIFGNATNTDARSLDYQPQDSFLDNNTLDVVNTSVPPPVDEALPSSRFVMSASELQQVDRVHSQNSTSSNHHNNNNHHRSQSPSPSPTHPVSTKRTIIDTRPTAEVVFRDFGRHDSPSLPPVQAEESQYEQREPAVELETSYDEQNQQGAAAPRTETKTSSERKPEPSPASRTLESTLEELTKYSTTAGSRMSSDDLVLFYQWKKGQARDHGRVVHMIPPNIEGSPSVMTTATTTTTPLESSTTSGDHSQSISPVLVDLCDSVYSFQTEFNVLDKACIRLHQDASKLYGQAASDIEVTNAFSTQVLETPPDNPSADTSHGNQSFESLLLTRRSTPTMSALGKTASIPRSAAHDQVPAERMSSSLLEVDDRNKSRKNLPYQCHDIFSKLMSLCERIPTQPVNAPLKSSCACTDCKSERAVIQVVEESVRNMKSQMHRVLTRTHSLSEYLALTSILIDVIYELEKVEIHALYDEKELALHLRKRAEESVDEEERKKASHEIGTIRDRLSQNLVQLDSMNFARLDVDLDLDLDVEHSLDPGLGGEEEPKIELPVHIQEAQAIREAFVERKRRLVRHILFLFETELDAGMIRQRALDTPSMDIEAAAQTNTEYTAASTQVSMLDENGQVQPYHPSSTAFVFGPDSKAPEDESLLGWCFICEDNSALYVAPCSHMCCKGCWNEWLSRNKSCPICRRYIHPWQLQERLKNEEKQFHADKIDLHKIRQKMRV